MSALVVGRGDPVTPGAPPELLVLGVIVAGFWVLVGLVLFALWFARRRRAARPEVEAHVERDSREHLAWLDKLRERDDEQPTLDLPSVVRVVGRHRRQPGS